MVTAIPSSTHVLFMEINSVAVKARVKLCPTVKAVTHQRVCFQSRKVKGKVRASKNNMWSYPSISRMCLRPSSI